MLFRSEKMLIQELKALVKLGIVTRKAYPEVPPRVEYSLTQEGIHVLPIISQIKVFGNRLLDDTI